MTLLRLELSDPLTSALADDDFADTAERLMCLRAQFCEKHPDLTKRPIEEIPARVAFDDYYFSMPEQMLLAYERCREASELGYIFRIANGFHDVIDAIVIHGRNDLACATKTLSTACCDPYHNEQSRAERGSKPRIYFSSVDFENDEMQSLIWRLQRGGYGDTAADARWMLIVNEDAGAQTFGPLAKELAKQGDERSSWMTEVKQNAPKYYTTVVKEDRLLRIPYLKGPQLVLSPAVLLPAAFLGLDCIQLLVGAAKTNERFRYQPFDSNPVLQFAAANHALRKTGHHRAMGAWPRALDGIIPWYSSLLFRTFPNAALSLTPLLDGRLQGTYGWKLPPNVVCHQLFCESIRTDPFQSDDNGWSPEKQRSDMLHFENDATRRNVPFTRLTVPAIDTHSLGQLLQFLLLATEMECRLEEAEW